MTEIYLFLDVTQINKAGARIEGGHKKKTLHTKLKDVEYCENNKKMIHSLQIEDLTSTQNARQGSCSSGSSSMSKVRLEVRSFIYTVLAILLWILHFPQKKSIETFFSLVKDFFFNTLIQRYVLNIEKHLVHPYSVKGLVTA